MLTCVRWLSRFPARNITRFFEVIDTWQAKIIVAELDRSQAASTAGLLALPASFLQLFLNEPTLLSTSGIVLGANGAPSNSELAASIERLSAALDTAVSGSNVNGPSIASSLGLNPVMVALLSSPEITRRQWALNQIELMTRAIAFDEWSESGIGTEVQNLFLAAHPGGIVEQWRSMKVLIDERRLKVDTVQKGLLEGLYEAGTPARADRSVMSYIARLLGSPSDSMYTPPDAC